MPYRLDTDTHVYFYENDFYVLSNFSAFRLRWRNIDFDTSEHAYHWEKFCLGVGDIAEQRRLIQGQICVTRSAHEAFKLAKAHRALVRTDWPDVRVGLMKAILREKALQHEYVRRKLFATGQRILVEDSWRDDFWGTGPNGQGQNMLGTLWMELRQELTYFERLNNE